MKRKILVTGGTVFVSKYVAQYFNQRGDEVYVLNRNRHVQPEGTILIEADRKNPGQKLKHYSFDAVLDITAYTGEDVTSLLDALGEFKEYILISSSAVYPETLSQPFREEQPLGVNRYWGAYGTNKIEAEWELFARVPQAYILRPPYLYGPLNNVYREAFVFECALQNRRFYIPGDGSMKLQFFHVRDLCRFMDILLEKKPVQHIFNVGNPGMISIADWVMLCYRVAGKEAELVPVPKNIEQRQYFSFYDYEYQLDLSKQKMLMDQTIPLEEGLREAFAWYIDHKEEVNRKPYMEYIDTHL